MSWHDYKLQWDPAQYDGLDTLRFPDNLLWKPDILLYNSADQKFDPTFNSKIVVSSSGKCLHIPPGIFKSTCRIDTRWFPFDIQKCDLKFGSWTYGGLSLDLSLIEADISEYVPNGEWDLVGITVLLSLIVFMLLLAEIMPATSDSAPLIVQYFVITMGIVALSVILTVVVLQVHHRDPNAGRMPKWIRVGLLEWCAWFLRMKRPGEDNTQSNLTSMDVKARMESGHSASPQSGEGELLLIKYPSPTVSSSESELADILDEVRYIAKRFRDQQQVETMRSDWKFAAAVVDRLCFVIFLTFIVLCTFGFLMSTPNFTEDVSNVLS